MNFRDIINNILLNNKVSDEAQSATLLMQMSQEQQQKSTTSSDRKDRIVNCLFLNRRQTVVMLNMFKGLLGTFQHYVKYFQSEKPLIHLLHNKIVDVVKRLLGMFIKPEHIPDSVSKLKQLDVTNRSIQKADRDLGVGKHAYADLNKSRVDKKCHHWVTKVYDNLRVGYVLAAQKILKMPIENKTLRLMSVLDPEFVGHSQTEVSFKKIAEKMPQAFPSEEMGQLAVDAARYNTDKEVKMLASQYSEADPIDTGFWAKVSQLQSFNQVRYPALKKLVTSVLTIFSGPLIESTFNIMDDIIEKDRTKMTVVNYEAVAIVKTVLRKKNVKSTDMEVPTSMKKFCINAYATYKKHVKEMKEERQKKHEEKLQSSVQLLKVEKAKRVVKLMRLKNRILGQKRKSTSGGHDGDIVRSLVMVQGPTSGKESEHSDLHVQIG